MVLRKGIFALAAMGAVELAARDASASVVALTVTGCNNGQTIQATCQVNFTFPRGMNGKSGQPLQLCGGIIFSDTCSGPDFGTTGSIVDPLPSGDKSQGNSNSGDNNGNPSGPCNTDISNWNDGNPAGPCANDVVPPASNPASASPTPLPPSALGGGALLAGLGVMRRIRRMFA